MNVHEIQACCLTLDAKVFILSGSYRYMDERNGLSREGDPSTI
jgi:hypothetical protein